MWKGFLVHDCEFAGPVRPGVMTISALTGISMESAEQQYVWMTLGNAIILHLGACYVSKPYTCVELVLNGIVKRQVFF